MSMISLQDSTFVSPHFSSKYNAEVTVVLRRRRFLADILTRQDCLESSDNTHKYHLIKWFDTVSCATILQSSLQGHLKVLPQNLYHKIQPRCAKTGRHINNLGLINTSPSLRSACVFTPKFGRLCGSCLRLSAREGDFIWAVAERRLFLLSLEWPWRVKRITTYPGDKSIKTARAGDGTWLLRPDLSCNNIRIVLR